MRTVKALFVILLLYCPGALLTWGLGGVNILLLYSGIFIFTLSTIWLLSDRIILSGIHSTPLPENHGLQKVLEKLALKLELNTPEVFVIPSSSPNAFTIGNQPKSAKILVTSSFLALLSDDEIEALLGHEMSHLYYRDTYFNQLFSALATSLYLIVDGFSWLLKIFGKDLRSTPYEQKKSAWTFLVLTLLSPLCSSVIRMTHSPKWDFRADAKTVEITGKPECLKIALVKLGRINHKIPLDLKPTLTHLLTYQPERLTQFLPVFGRQPSLEERLQSLG
jgi:heat shock protein HtpX